MLSLTGKLIDIARTQATDQKTGEVSQVFAAEILHKERGKSVVESLKFDASVLPHWEKAIGKELTVEVRMYAMGGNGGSVQSGLAMADKKSLPVFWNAAPVSKPVSLAA